MNETFTILLGGALAVDDRVLALVAGSRVIAADGGMRHAGALGVRPEVWVGDFDSTDADLVARF
ncbi:MAG: thiamine diphosphokinase, partial [Martelella sp.]